MSRIFYFIIAMVEFASYLLIDPFHMLGGWKKNDGKKMLVLRRAGIAIMISGIVAAVVPVIYHRIVIA